MEQPAGRAAAKVATPGSADVFTNLEDIIQKGTHRTQICLPGILQNMTQRTLKKSAGNTPWKVKGLTVSHGLAVSTRSRITYATMAFTALDSLYSGARIYRWVDCNHQDGSGEAFEACERGEPGYACENIEPRLVEQTTGCKGRAGIHRHQSGEKHVLAFKGSHWKKILKKSNT
jgi:hypothetical protein